jgi:hypothetical protein
MGYFIFLPDVIYPASVVTGRFLDTKGPFSDLRVESWKISQGNLVACLPREKVLRLFPHKMKSSGYPWRVALKTGYVQGAAASCH